MRRWGQRIRLWAVGAQPADAHLIDPAAPVARHTRAVFCYFDNSLEGHAPHDAHRLLRLLELDRGLQQAPGLMPQDEGWEGQ